MDKSVKNFEFRGTACRLYLIVYTVRFIILLNLIKKISENELSAENCLLATETRKLNKIRLLTLSSVYVNIIVTKVTTL